jgi:uncharacterized protein (TIGR03067 family)
MNRILLMGLLAMSVCACEAQDTDELGDRAVVQTSAINRDGRLVGRWRVVHAEVSGTILPDEVIAPLRFEFDDSTVSHNYLTGRTVPYQVGPEPGWISFTSQLVEDGIYRLEGDLLMICSGPAGSDRPGGFRTTRENRYMLWALKRVESADR